MEIWIPIIISILTLILSAVQLHKQQKLANQHRLWDKRMQQYRVLQSIMHTYKENRFLLWSHSKVQQNIAEAADQLYEWMSNCDVVRVQLTKQIQDPEHQHIAIQDFLHDCVEQTKVLWDAPISNLASQMIEAYMNLLHRLHQQAKFNQYENEAATKWHIPLHVIQQRKYTQAENGKVYQSVQECEIAYNNCTRDNVLHYMKNTLTLSNISPLTRIKSWLKSKQSKSKPSLHKPDEMLVEHQTSVIDIHDKRLSQLFKICYIAAIGFACAFMETATLSSDVSSIARYMLPAIVYATAFVVLWIISHALTAGQCYHYDNPKWVQIVQKSNITYRKTIIMIRCAILWMIAAFVIAFISQKMPQIIAWFKSANVTYTMLLLWLYSCVIRMKIVCSYKGQYLWLTKTCTHIMYLCGLAWCTVTLW